MLKRYILLLGLILSLIVPVMAQDSTSPTAAIDAALTAVEEQVGTRSANYTFELLGETNDSSLGCPLITGEELPINISAVRVTVIYPDASYLVYSSSSGQTTLLCDAQFGQDVINAQLNPEDACEATPISPVPAYIAPNITVDGVFTAGVEAYPIFGVSSDRGWYQIISDLGVGWVEASATTVTGDCTNLPITSVTNPLAEGVCFVRPQGSFTNVRSGATTDSNMVARIYENEVYQITARNTAGDWFYIQPVGWVANSVVFPEGDCVNIPVDDNVVGVGFIVVDDSQNTSLPSDVGVIMQQFACPSDFAGYLVPRIELGESNAQIVAGNIPNTLRAFPSVDDAQAPRLGVIQPQRVLDRVLAGPACNQGFVWWLVDIDSTVGWTAESNQSSDDYYIEPVGGVVETTGTFDELEVSTNPVTELIYTTDGSRLFALSSAQGFGTASSGVVIIFDGATGETLARIEEPTGIVDIDYDSLNDAILVANGSGVITAYDAQELVQTVQLTGLYSVDEGLFVEIQQSSQQLLVASCADTSCTTSLIRRMDFTRNEESARVVTLSPALGLALSADGSTLAVLTAEGVNFYIADSLMPMSTWANSDSFAIDSVALNANGSSALVAGCNNNDCTQGRIGLVTVADGSLLGIVPSHTASATNVTFNNDGTRFVTVALDSGEIIERSATTGEEIQRFDVQLVNVASIAYTTDGTQLAVGTSDGRIQFFTLEQ